MMSNNDNPGLNTLAFKIERIYGFVEAKEYSLGKARNLTREAIIEYVDKYIKNTSNDTYFKSEIQKASRVDLSAINHLIL